jgi:hypothetical protein
MAVNDSTTVRDNWCCAGPGANLRCSQNGRLCFHDKMCCSGLCLDFYKQGHGVCKDRCVCKRFPCPCAGGSFQQPSRVCVPVTMFKHPSSLDELRSYKLQPQDVITLFLTMELDSSINAGCISRMHHMLFQRCIMLPFCALNDCDLGVLTALTALL